MGKGPLCFSYNLFCRRLYIQMMIKPNCWRCRTNVNVVDHGSYWRCAFCGITWNKQGQIRLDKWIKEKKQK